MTFSAWRPKRYSYSSDDNGKNQKAQKCHKTKT